MALRHLVRRPVRRALHGLGYEIAPIRPPWPADFREADIALYREVAPYTMTTPEAIYALAEAVRYLAANEIPGAIVECGVWKGGSMMAVALTLNRLGETDRDLYLFDTFTGLPQPGTADCSSPYDGYDIHRRWRRKRRSGWVSVPGAEVRRNLESTGYPPEHIHLVEGMVEETVPEHAPERIALLRLDTDWYESTRHELEHLYPRLVPSGVLIVDDYGHYEGARRAVDEFLATSADPVLLNRIDYTGRVAVKPAVDLGAAPGGAR
jgi:O-methyltransferase